MKRYRQLFLLIISVISTTLLLIYWHEYNRLHYVLEVFNFFGNPCNLTNLQDNKNVLVEHDWGPVHVWQHLGKDNYIYSAYWSKGEAKALVYSKDPKTLPKYCNLLVEDVDIIHRGSIKYSNIIRQNQIHTDAYIFTCNQSIKLMPYTLSLKKENVDVLLRNIDDHKSDFNMTVCVVPAEKFNKAALLEFISYHKTIGIDSFVFYNNNIPPRLSKFLTNVSIKLGYNITFLPWNFPLANSNLSRIFIENDCSLRTLHNSKNVITLDVNEYIVPTKYTSINMLLSDFKDETKLLNLPVQEFCITQSARSKPISLQNLKANRDSPNVVYHIYRNFIEESVVHTQVLDKGFASIHRYVHCNEVPSRVFEDNGILKFSTDFVRSTLVQLLIHDKI